MDKAEFMKGIRILQNNYNKKYTKEQLELFYENLQDMNKERYLENINEIIRTNEFMPNIAQIRKEPKKIGYQNYDQRDYESIDFESLYAN